MTRKALAIKIAAMMLIGLAVSVVSAVAIWGIGNHELPPLRFIMQTLVFTLVAMAPMMGMVIHRVRQTKAA